MVLVTRKVFLTVDQLVKRIHSRPNRLTVDLHVEMLRDWSILEVPELCVIAHCMLDVK